jgi:hypothetical protein
MLVAQLSIEVADQVGAPRGGSDRTFPLTKCGQSGRTGKPFAVHTSRSDSVPGATGAANPSTFVEGAAPSRPEPRSDCRAAETEKCIQPHFDPPATLCDPPLRSARSGCAECRPAPDKTSEARGSFRFGAGKPSGGIRCPIQAGSGCSVSGRKP